MDANKTNANMNQGMGQAKETAGNMMGSDRMQSEGQAQNTSGKLEGMTSKAQHMFSDFTSKAKNEVNNMMNNFGGKSGGSGGANTN